MAILRVRDLFNGRFFYIPKYQRGYAWELEQVRELFEDILEAMESNSNHYLGTIILSKISEGKNKFFIVDGQQRITTLMLIINDLIHRFENSDKEYYYRFYISENKCFRLTPLGKDKEFFFSLLNRNPKEPATKSQRLLKKAYDEINQILNNLSTIYSIDYIDLLKAIEELEILQFIEESEGDAIRIFQTVNDRGKPLSNMEKAKSLLIYFSNRYLNKKYDSKINDLFGEIFECFDEIKSIADEVDITLIKNVDFTEDNIMRYHFVTFSNEDFNATSQYVLKFLKRKLNEYRNDKLQLDQFILSYTSTLNEFFKSLKNIVERCKTDKLYFETFSILGLSATLYPILVTLENKGLLNKKINIQNWENYTFFEMIRNIDIRVYKTRGTDPRADILRYTYEISNNDNITDIEIANWLDWFNRRWMSSQEFSAKLNTEIYGNAALPYLFLKYCEYLEKKEYSLDELKLIKTKSPTIEHILSQHPNFSVTAYGFKDEEEYAEYEHMLGNLTILEKKLNSAARDKTPIEKAAIYENSVFKMSKEISSYISISGKFAKNDILNITQKLSSFIKQICPC